MVILTKYFLQCAVKGNRKHSNVTIYLYQGYIRVQPTGKCTNWFVIMNVEVETNVETQILS